jgi:hypothetical protein
MRSARAAAAIDLDRRSPRSPTVIGRAPDLATSSSLTPHPCRIVGNSCVAH